MRPDLGPVPPARLFWLGLFAVAKAVGLVLVAEAIARGIVGVQAGDLDVRLVTLLGVGGALLRAFAGWATQVAAHRVASAVKQDLRRRLWRRIAVGDTGAPAADAPARGARLAGATARVNDGPRGAGPERARREKEGSLVALASEGLDDLDDYYTQSLPTMIAAVAVPAVVGLRILSADWISALIIVLTIPLIPVFMILIGKHTQDRTDEATGALTRLADHLTELARGLPVLVGLGRIEDQTRALDRIQRDYRERTLTTLRTAFLSALALELIATLSVAVVAVFLGLRLLYGTIDLAPALLALILAPEIYGALRDVGTAFHASQSGLSALARTEAFLAAPPRADARTIAPERGHDTRAWSGSGPHSQKNATLASATGVIGVRSLTVRYADRDRPALDTLDADLTGITAITGPSGAGKSTLLAALTGTLPPDAEITGSIELPARERGGDPRAWPESEPRSRKDATLASGVAWAPQAPRGFGGTAREELELYGAADPDAALAELGMEHVADAAVAELSPGELRRLAVARALARVDAGAWVLVLDEPTAHLDAESAERVRAAILRRADRATVVLATHEPETLALATAFVGVGAPSAAPASVDSVLRVPQNRRDAAHTAPPERRDSARSDRRAGRDEGRRTGAGLRSILRPARWRWIGAIALGVIAMGLGLSLTGVSGWLIVRASVEEYIMYLLVAIVGVRFFGIGRSVARYLERLATHDVAFRVTDALRLRLWRGIAARGAGSRRLLEGGAPIDYLVTQANALRDQLPRTIPPIAVGVVSIAGLTIAVAFVAPLLAPVVGAVLAGAAALGSLLAVLAERGAGAAGVAERAAIVRGTASLAAAADDLRGNGVASRATGADHDDLDSPPATRSPASEASVPRMEHSDSPRRGAVPQSGARRVRDGRRTGEASVPRVASRGRETHARMEHDDSPRKREIPRRGVRTHENERDSTALAQLDATAERLARAEERAAWGAGLGTAVAMLATSLLAAIAAPLAARHGIAAEPLAVVALLSLAALEPIAGLIAAAQRVPAMRATLRRIAPVLEPVPPALTGHRDLDGPTASLALDRLAASYPANDAAPSGVPVFSDVSGRVERGGWLVVDGPSGSGKSTLLSILMGALPPAAGGVAVDGHALGDLSPEAWRRRVAWCPQDAYVFDSTLRGNLLLARDRDDAPSDREQRHALERAGLGDLLARLPDGLDTRVGAGGAALSGGERQRLAVARALLSRADVLLLDEPTAHLDAPTAEAMMRDIRAASAERITVLVSHRATDHADGDRMIRLG